VVLFAAALEVAEHDGDLCTGYASSAQDMQPCYHIFVVYISDDKQGSSMNDA